MPTQWRLCRLTIEQYWRQRESKYCLYTCRCELQTCLSSTDCTLALAVFFMCDAKTTRLPGKRSYAMALLGNCTRCDSPVVLI